MPPEIRPGARQPEQLTPTAEDEFSLMTWNVENLFDNRAPHPSDPPMPRLAEYELAIAKVAHTILAAGAPTVVALQEVENIGVLETIARYAPLAAYEYQAVLVEGADSRGIDVGYLLRGDQARVLDVRQYVAPEGLTSRPPLLVELEVATSQGSTRLYVINNHFTSMSGGVEATEPRRTAQAAWNVKILAEIQATGPDARVAVLGDLNAYYDSLPIDTLRAAGLVHVFEAWDDPETAPYTYIFEGESQTLDHILVTPSLMEMMRRVEILHTNADFPPVEAGDPSPLRKSDHDPVVATFSLAP